MIGIATTTSNAAGAVILKEFTDSGKYDSTARISKVSTLDGGVVMVHSGVTDGDRNISVKARLSATDEGYLKDIYEDETLVVVSTADGCYLGGILNFNKNNGIVTISISIKEKISQ